MKQTIFYITMMILFSSCLHKKYNKVASEITAQHTKMEAKEFSMFIINTYFEEDCDEFFGYLSDSIMIMDGDGIFATKGHNEKLCSSVKKAIRDKEKTIDNYVQTYKIEMLNREELELKFKAKLPDYYITTDFDYFFLGFELKEGVEKSNPFIWDDMFMFMVRKENNIWKLKGISG